MIITINYKELIIYINILYLVEQGRGQKIMWCVILGCKVCFWQIKRNQHKKSLNFVDKKCLNGESNS